VPMETPAFWAISRIVTMEWVTDPRKSNLR
jgi:hypothetical protein